MQLPSGLKDLTGRPDMSAWCAALPDLLRDILRDWDLIVDGPPYPRSHVSYTIPVRAGSGPAVLKLQWPHPECAFEADALMQWNGQGAVRLLAHDRARHALLLERCFPGTTLAESGEADKLTIYLDLLPQLSILATGPFRSLEEEAAEWRSSLVQRWDAEGRPCPVRMIDEALTFLAELPGSGGDAVLIHQDLHAGNILAAERAAYISIDPKPLTGERAFALAPVINSFELGHSRREVVERLDRLSAGLGLDRERARGWAIAQAMAWSFETPFAAKRHDVAAWLIDAA